MINKIWTYRRSNPNRILLIVSNLPIENSGVLFNLANKLMLRIKISFKILHKVYAILSTEFLILELMAAVYLGYAFSVIYAINQYLALSVWVSYPIVIGVIKKLQEKFIKEFHIEEIFEFMALNIAAFPYRFIYLTIDSPFPATGVLAIKFSYKSLNYIVALSNSFLIISIKV